MNLKNNYLLKKTVKWTNKNVRILIFTVLYFFRKNKEKHMEILFYILDYFILQSLPKILMI